MKKEVKLVLAAVALLVIAGLLFLRFSVTGDGSVKYATPPTQADIDKQISDIQNNPHMPDNVKAIAIGQIKARSQGVGAPVKPSAGQ